MGPKLATVSLVLLTLFTNSFQSPYSSSTPECPSYYNGSIAGNSCSREYSICVNGVRQEATCAEEHVFYEDKCIPIEDSPECQAADDTEDAPYEHFDCSSKTDGLNSIGCVNQFVNCVAGQAYQMYCPDDLVFNGNTQDCQESCDDTEEDTTTAAPIAYKTEDDRESYEEGSAEIEGYYETEPTTEEPETVDFDCNGLDNGNYAEGCSDVFYSCNNNVAFKRYCPEGTVFNPSQQVCDYDCNERVTTTTQSYAATTNADIPSTTESYRTTPQNDDPEYSTTRGFDEIVTTTTTTRAPIICPEGQLRTFGVCSSRFDRCQNNAIRSKQCPVNTLFESALVLCVFDLPQCQPVTVPSTPTYNAYGGSASDAIVSPFDENIRLKPKFNRRPHYYRRPVERPGYGTPLVENPFFVPRHTPYHHGGYRHHRRRGYYRPAIQSPFSTMFRGRAALNDQFKDIRRVKMGKLPYGESRQVQGNKRYILDDKFEGPKARFVPSNIQQIFPEDRHSKRKLGPREDVDGYKDDKTFDAKDLFGATRRKRSAEYGYQQQGQGQQYPQISARQAQVNKDCQQYTTPTFLTFGDCFDQFIYCSGNGVNRMAACPVGETFNKALRTCSETCGVVAPVVTATVGTQTADDSTSSSTFTGNDVAVFTTTASYSYETYTTEERSNDQSYTTGSSSNDQPFATTQSWDDQPSTTVAPIGDRCASVVSALFSIGCSQKYLQCSNGIAIVRSCSGDLYFNEEQQMCSFKELVLECGAQDTTTYSWVVTLPADDQITDSYESQPDDTPATTSFPVGDRCATMPSGLLTIGCSQKYIQCASGVAIVRSCSEALYFNGDKQTCSLRSEVPECGAKDAVPYYPSVTVSSDDYSKSSSYGSHADDNPSTTRAPVGDRCADVPSGLFDIGCSQKYIQCSYGVGSVRMCTASLYFNQVTQTCMFRDEVPKCQSNDNTGYYSSTGAPGQGETTTVGYEQPDDLFDNTYQTSDDQPFTTSGYRNSYEQNDPSSTTSSYENTSEPSEEQPTTYIPSVAPYKPFVPDQKQDEQQDACDGLSDGSHGQGCSSSYIVCSYGRLVNTLTCPLGQGYDPSVQICRTFSEIAAQACDQMETTTDAGLVQPLPYITLEEVLDTTQDTITTTIGNVETTDSYITVGSDDYTTTFAYGGETPASDATTRNVEYTTPAGDTTVVTDSYNRADDSEDEEEIGYNEKCTIGSRASTGFCVQDYLECIAGSFVEKSCRVGKLFDTHDNRCVPRIACGKEAIREAIKDVFATTTVPSKSVDGRCAHVEGDGVFALGACSSSYVRCSYGAAKLQYCGGNQVFSNAMSTCVNRDSAAECKVSQNEPVKNYYNNNEQSAFCDGKADGLYGNKRDCSAILQCFGGELFQHASCPANLAFNELTDKCDYPQKVSGCENHGKTNGVCTEHGSFIADVRDCSIFYRCVWGRKVVMKCPTGTVFNPALSVCDWPSAVPSCGRGPSTDSGFTSYGSSSSNDDKTGY